jgi:hypothetical protein
VRGFTGAYGMRLEGLGAGAMLIDAPPAWPTLTLSTEIADLPVVDERVSATEALLRLKTGGRLSLDRAGRMAHYSVPRPLSVDELVHPYLAPAAAMFAHWDGRLAFHAGAFVVAGGIWAVAGTREAGKSTTLARLAARGVEVFADDVVILDGLRAFAGPRAVDLRPDTAHRLGVGRALGVVGSRPRWRIELPPCRAELPFRGWMFVEWAERPQARRLRASECLGRLAETLTVRLDPLSPRDLLDLAALPAWSVGRERQWDRLDDHVDHVLELARQYS